MEFFDRTREWSRTRKRIIALKKRGWSQVRIAEALGKHKQYVNKVLKEYERGKANGSNRSPSTEG